MAHSIAIFTAALVLKDIEIVKIDYAEKSEDDGVVETSIFSAAETTRQPVLSDVFPRFLDVRQYD